MVATQRALRLLKKKCRDIVNGGQSVQSVSLEYTTHFKWLFTFPDPAWGASKAHINEIPYKLS